MSNNDHIAEYTELLNRIEKTVKAGGLVEIADLRRFTQLSRKYGLTRQPDFNNAPTKTRFDEDGLK